MIVKSFAPVLTPECHTLILGTVPGRESLRKQQYYGYARNPFWRLVGEICGFDHALPYPERLAALNRHGIGLWSLIKQCERPGSLDSNIKNPEFNDLAGLFVTYPNLKKICLDGKSTEKFLRRYQAKNPLPEFTLLVLPSSSPAHAALRYEEKLIKWRKCLT
ncbi:MAG: DNA-deoxyinosine glycosylase [Victivallaceae bacterium]|nr:DNA-deoxyinosine glycosylase [Victivallaceae bacterium]MDD4181889.1 DNA-deoxyinosine glycosylase [Victivallaceae bacterium]